MKTFGLLGMALIAILVSVNFASCSSGDDEITKNDDGVVTNEKKLVELKMLEDSDIITWDFSYDTKDRLASVIHTEKHDGGTDRNITNYTWGNNIIMAEDGRRTRTYSLNDGLVSSGSESDGRDYSFTYNSSKQLTTYQYSDKYDSNSITLTWENGKVTKTAYEGDEPSKITYSNQTCKGYFPLMALMVEDDFTVMLAHPELIGMRVIQLPSQINSKDDYGENKEELTYTFDKNGYVESCAVKGTYIRNGRIETDTTIYTFKWE